MHFSVTIWLQLTSVVGLISVACVFEIGLIVFSFLTQSHGFSQRIVSKKPDRSRTGSKYLLTSVSDTPIWSFCLEDASRSASFPVRHCASDVQVSLPCLPLLLDNFLFAKLFLSRSPHLRGFFQFFLAIWHIAELFVESCPLLHVVD